MSWDLKTALSPFFRSSVVLPAGRSGDSNLCGDRFDFRCFWRNFWITPILLLYFRLVRKWPVSCNAGCGNWVGFTVTAIIFALYASLSTMDGCGTDFKVIDWYRKCFEDTSIFNQLLVERLNYFIYVVLLLIGLWAMIAKNNLIKKLIGMSIFQTAIILFYVSIGVKEDTIPIYLPEHDPHVLIWA